MTSDKSPRYEWIWIKSFYVRTYEYVIKITTGTKKSCGYV